MDNALLQLEESLQILEELIQCDARDSRATSSYIKRLKQFYSPQFNFEYSESGSYYFAALKCLSINYLETDAIYSLPLSRRFQDSLQTLLDIALLNVDSPTNNSVAAEKLVELASFWGFNSTLDIANLIIQTLQEMRAELLTHIDTYHG